MQIENAPARAAFRAEKMNKINLFSVPQFFVDVYCLEPGQEQKPHSHREEAKVYYVLEGEGTFRVGAEERVCGAGDAVLAPAGEEHGVRNHSGARLTLLVMMAPNPGAA